MQETYQQQNEILLLRALASQKQANADQAQAAVEQAVTLAEPGGWVRPFVESGADLTPLLTRLIDQRGAAVYTRKLLSACRAEKIPAGRISPPSQTQLLDPLTNRENEILELPGKHLNNKAIVSSLHI